LLDRHRIQSGTVQGEMSRTGHSSASQDGLKLASRFQSLHLVVAAKLLISFALCGQLNSDSQALAALGAAGIDHSAAATGLHANQKAVSAGAANLGGLVSAFHFENPKGLDENQPAINWGESLSCLPRHDQRNRRLSQILSSPARP
jgi:hypothetical protein